MLAKTKEVLDILAQDDFFKNSEVKFVGGTALSYLIDHRLSEDLDFAMLEISPKDISKMMLRYGATTDEHSNQIKDISLNDGEDIHYSHLKYNLDGVKVEFFLPPFNLMEIEIWKNDLPTYYENSDLKIASLETILYMKTMAFWNRKKYRDLFDIYFVLYHNLYTTKDFLERYIKYNITYTKEILLKKIQSKEEFHKKSTDEGLYTLVENPNEYEWYRAKIEEFIYNDYLEQMYK